MLLEYKLNEAYHASYVGSYQNLKNVDMIESLHVADCSWTRLAQERMHPRGDGCGVLHRLAKLFEDRKTADTSSCIGRLIRSSAQFSGAIGVIFSHFNALFESLNPFLEN